MRTCVAAIVMKGLDGGDGLAEAQRDAVLAQVIDERLHDLAVDEWQQLGPRVDHRHANAERGKKAGVLEADDAGAHDRQRAREVFNGQEIVAGEDVLAIEPASGVVDGRRADRDDDVRRGDLRVRAVGPRLEPEPVRIDKRGLRRQDIHAFRIS